MTTLAADRRRALVATLYFAPAGTASVLQLARDMELVHSIATSRDQVRGDLIWLQEQSLVAMRDDLAQLTERGRDVARRTAPWPGGD